MDAHSLLQALLTFDNAGTAPERLRVLNDHPVLLASGLPDLIGDMEATATGDSDPEAACMLRRIGSHLRFLQHLDEDGQLPPLTVEADAEVLAPDALWPLLVRYHLSLGEPTFLHRAIEVANRAGQEDVAVWLGSHLNDDPQWVDLVFSPLANRLFDDGNIDGGRAIALMWINHQWKVTVFKYSDGQLAIQDAEEVIRHRERVTKQATTISYLLQDELLMAHCATEVAKNCILTEEYSRAEEWLEKGLSASPMLGAFGEKHLDTFLLTAYSDLAMVYRSTDRLVDAANAVECCVEVLGRLEEHVPHLRGSQAIMLVQLGFSWLYADNLETAEDAFRAASSLLEEEHALSDLDYQAAIQQLQEGLEAVTALRRQSKASAECQSLLAELDAAEQDILRQTYATFERVGGLTREAAEIELIRVLQLCETITSSDNELVRSTTALARAALAEVLVDVGQPGAAEILCRKALEYLGLVRSAGDGKYLVQHAAVHNTLGKALLANCRAWVQSAIDEHRIALSILEEAEDLGPDTVTTLYHLSGALLEAGQAEEAMECLDQALSLPSDLEQQVGCLLLASRALLERGQLEEARDRCRTALSAVSNADSALRGVCLSTLGLIQFEQRQYVEAVCAVREAIVVLQSGQPAPTTLPGFGRAQEPVSACYDLLMLSLMRLGQFEGALVAAENSRACSLNALFSSQIACSSDLTEHQALVELSRLFDVGHDVLDTFIERLAEGNFFSNGAHGLKYLPRIYPDLDWEAIFQDVQRLTAEKLKGQRDALRNDRLASQERLVEQHRLKPENDSDRERSLPLDASGILSLAKGADVALVTIRATDWGTCVLMAFPNGTTTGFELPQVTIRELRHLIHPRNQTGSYSEQGWASLHEAYKETNAESNVVGDTLWQEAHEYRRRWLKEMEKVLRQLGEQIARPLAGCLEVNWAGQSSPPRIVIVASNQLALLPIHAFTWNDDGEHSCLLDHCAVQYAPSLSVFGRCMEQDHSRYRKGSLFAVGNPSPPGNLIYSELECSEIARIFTPVRCQIVTGEYASRDLVVERLRTANWLHLSCHGESKSFQPFHSCIKLAGDEPLTVAEILANGKLDHAWLVILGACESGRVSDVDLADNHFGLPAAFLFAGAPTVFASLWLLDDSPATVLLVSKIYEILVESTIDKSSALRAAQLWLRDLEPAEAIVELQRLCAAEGVSRRLMDALRETIAQIQALDDWGDSTVRPFAHPAQWANLACFGA